MAPDTPLPQASADADRDTAPLVSVIIPAYNCANWLPETVESVLAQDYPNMEVIIVVDGAKDNTEEVARRYESDPRLRVVWQQNAGVSAARNHGHDLSRGSYLSFLDSDDVWLPTRVSACVARLEAEPALGLVHTDMAVIDEKSQPTGEVKQGKEGWVLRDLLLWNGTVIPAPSSVLIRREAFEAVGRWDLELSNAADKELFIRIAAQYPVGRIAQPLGQYRVLPGSMSKSISLMERDERVVFRKIQEYGLFESESFRRRCTAIMLKIVAASWWVNGGRKGRALRLMLEALWTYPPILGVFFRR